MICPLKANNLPTHAGQYFFLGKNSQRPVFIEIGERNAAGYLPILINKDKESECKLTDFDPETLWSDEIFFSTGGPW